MKPFNPSRVNAEFRDHVTCYSPVLGRKYTMTHSDETAELYVTIGRTYARDKFSEIRDEVLLCFEKNHNQLQLTGTVIIDNDEITKFPDKRNEIFLREMPTALLAIRYADCRLFDRNHHLDQVPIIIHFQSKDDKFDRYYNFGIMKDYQWTE